MGELWERQANEPARAHDHFQAWLAFLAAGGERSLGKFAEAHGISRDLAKKLSGRHDWRHRTTAYQSANVLDVDATRTDVMPAPPDVLPTSATPAMVEQITEARMDLAQRRLRLAERRVDLAEQAADLADRALKRLRNSHWTELDPEIQVKILNAAARLLGDALPKELVIGTSGPSGRDLTDHPDWAPFADSIMGTLAEYPDAMEAFASMLQARLDEPDVIEAEVM